MANGPEGDCRLRNHQSALEQAAACPGWARYAMQHIHPHCGEDELTCWREFDAAQHNSIPGRPCNCHLLVKWSYNVFVLEQGNQVNGQITSDDLFPIKVVIYHCMNLSGAVRLGD